MGKSIAFVETSGVSSDELKVLCREIIPDVKVYQLIDDSLIQEVNANCGPTPFVRRRMMEYYRNAQELGVDLIINQCSSVGGGSRRYHAFPGYTGPEDRPGHGGTRRGAGQENRCNRHRGIHNRPPAYG